ncbi:MAG: 4-(cytidine 5'-diphospho)-2-C-methyl-D-erythritol kinase [Bdellovibrionota bacterium]
MNQQTSLGLAPCKINLFLKVFEKDLKGYHRLETAMVKLAFGDEIRIDVELGQGIEVHVPGFEELDQQNNLCYQAAQLVLRHLGIERKVHIHIQKNIPVAAGLAGGSTDAAHILMTLNRMLGQNIEENDLIKIAKTLGADVAFFLGKHNCALLEGRGDVFKQSTDLPPLPVVLVNPLIAVSTGKVFEKLGRSLTWSRGSDSSSIQDLDVRSWSDLDHLLKKGNDLEEVAQSMHPKIGLIREAFLDQGAMFSQMSGSGSTVFGLFDDVATAKHVAQQMSKFGRVICTQVLSPT